MLHKIHTHLCQVFTSKLDLDLPLSGTQSWVSITKTRNHNNTCKLVVCTTISQWMELHLQTSLNTNQPISLYTICQLVVRISLLFGSTTMIPYQKLTKKFKWYIIGTNMPEIMEIMYPLKPYITETTTMIHIEIQASLAQLVMSTMNHQLICLSTH